MSKALSLSKEELENLIKQHGNATKVANALGHSAYSVRSALKKHNIVGDNYRRKYDLNHYYFSPPYNPDSLYWAGYIAANGTVTTFMSGHPTYRVYMNMSEQDRPYLEMMRDALGSTAPVKAIASKASDGKSYHIATLLFNSRQMVDDLANFNIVPRKQHIYAMPEWLTKHPDIHHFLRGYTDGLGGFKLNADKTEVLDFSTTGTVEFLNQFRKIIAEKCSIFSERPITKSGTYRGRIWYYAKEDLVKIAKFLMQDGGYFMKKKWEIPSKLLLGN